VVQHACGVAIRQVQILLVSRIVIASKHDCMQSFQRSSWRTWAAYSTAGLRAGAGEAERLDADVRLASSRLRGGFSRSRSRPASLLTTDCVRLRSQQT